jgi:hypothetical protein
MRPDGNGKGDKPRPYSVTLETFDNNWDNIFKKKTEKDKDEGSDSNTDNRQTGTK